MTGEKIEMGEKQASNGRDGACRGDEGPGKQAQLCHHHPGSLGPVPYFLFCEISCDSPGKVTDLRHRHGGGWLPISTLNSYLSRDGQDGREHLAPLEGSRHCKSFQSQGNEILSAQR